LAAPKGHPCYGGRTKGVPNKITGKARAKFLEMFERLSPKTERWIEQTAKEGDPARAAELVLKMAEFYVPKLGRTEITGVNGERMTVTVNISGVRKEERKPNDSEQHSVGSAQRGTA
jgi:hypothetical protein